jgi:ribokinase
MHENHIKELHGFLKGELEERSIVVMPDFFLDRFMSLDRDVDAFARNLRSVTRKKGGSIDGIKQKDFRGGNAVNTASALSTLGTKVTPIVCTDKLGLQILQLYLDPNKTDLSHVKIRDRASITTAMEFETENGKANVMIRSLGSLSDFGPQYLNDSDWAAIENANHVCLFNWAGTRRFGTTLAQTVFRRTKNKGKGKTYYDTADPTPNSPKIPELMKAVLQDKYLDVLSLNENEAICYANQLDKNVGKTRKDQRFEETAGKAAKILAAHLPARIDLHTTSFSTTFTKKAETTVPAFRVPVLRATGAGDAWNAGNIIGDAYGLSDGCRLTLANAVAAYYVSNPEGEHPTRKKLAKFLKTSKT